MLQRKSSSDPEVAAKDERAAKDKRIANVLWYILMAMRFVIPAYILLCSLPLLDDASRPLLARPSLKRGRPCDELFIERGFRRENIILATSRVAQH
jgi:hypothetical protein